MTSEALKLAVSQAVKIGLDLRTARRIASAEGERTRQIAELMLASSIVDRLPELAGHAARLGRERLIVMVFGAEDYDRPYSHRNQWDTCLPAWLKGTARIVFDDCQSAGLSPWIELWSDTHGQDTGYKIVVRLR